MTLADSQQFST